MKGNRDWALGRIEVCSVFEQDSVNFFMPTFNSSHDGAFPFGIKIINRHSVC